jgi:tetratricopeptide (TPR) repeat protein
MWGVSVLLPMLGPFHLLQPRYNALSVLEVAKTYRPKQIILASYDQELLNRWQDTPEVSLFHLIPWAKQAGIPVVAALQAPSSEADFRQALAMYPKGQKILAELEDLEASLQTFLATPKMLEDFYDSVHTLPLKAYVEGAAALLGEGPGTGFRQARMQAVANMPLAPDTLVLADVLDFWVLKDLVPHSVPKHVPGEAERGRSILDRAWQLNPADDWAALLQQLTEVEGPEAMYCAAQIYLSAGQKEDAFAVLEQLVHTDFQEPAYLPGYTLARYGQLADLLGKRDTALRAYKAVLALEWAPEETRTTALLGQQQPFKTL